VTLLCIHYKFKGYIYYEVSLHCGFSFCLLNTMSVGIGFDLCNFA